MYRKPDGSWEAVGGASTYGAALDQFNTTHFDAVKTDALRIEAQLKPNFSAGLLRWRVNAADAK